ncbi:MAG: tRNA dihydrouridine(20/20a) synthase DusA [Myxococcota bacterium]
MMAALSIAPMMDWTDRHYRYMMRQLSAYVVLYTEMVTAEAILHGVRARLLDFDPAEHPLILQLGGSDPDKLREVSAMARAWGYDAVNLNVGCPSDRVQRGKIGACLMLEPELVASCVRAMREGSGLPVSVKHRIGVDHVDRYEDMRDFVKCVWEQSGCTHFSVHARIAWLKGLSPKANRNVPPLRYEDVYRLQQEFSDLWIEINGGVNSVEAVQEHLKHVRSVMIGRAAYKTPMLIAQLEHCLFGGETASEDVLRARLCRQMLSYLEQHMERGTSPHHVTRHMMGLFHGFPGARSWRQLLGQSSQMPKDLFLQKFLEKLCIHSGT